MRTAAAILALLVCCRTVPGQSQTPAPAKDENQLSPNVRIYQPKNVAPVRARAVADFVNSVLGSRVKVSWEDVPHAIVIRANLASELDAAEALLRRFDVPDQDVVKREIKANPQLDCTVYVIRASRASDPVQPTGEPIQVRDGTVVRAARPSPPTAAVPAELQSAIDEMKHSFGYDRFALWDAQPIAATGSGGDFQGLLPSALEGPTYTYSMVYKNAYPTSEKALAILGFEFSVRMPSTYFKEGIESHIKTDVTVREGQKLVLGKIRLLPSENADLFLVLATKAR